MFLVTLAGIVLACVSGVQVYGTFARNYNSYNCSYGNSTIFDDIFSNTNLGSGHTPGLGQFPWEFDAKNGKWFDPHGGSWLDIFKDIFDYFAESIFGIVDKHGGRRRFGARTYRTRTTKNRMRIPVVLKKDSNPSSSSPSSSRPSLPSSRPSTSPSSPRSPVSPGSPNPELNVELEELSFSSQESHEEIENNVKWKIRDYEITRREYVGDDFGGVVIDRNKSSGFFNDKDHYKEHLRIPEDAVKKHRRIWPTIEETIEVTEDQIEDYREELEDAGEIPRREYVELKGEPLEEKLQEQPFIRIFRRPNRPVNRDYDSTPPELSEISDVEGSEPESSLSSEISDESLETEIPPTDSDIILAALLIIIPFFITFVILLHVDKYLTKWIFDRKLPIKEGDPEEQQYEDRTVLGPREEGVHECTHEKDDYLIPPRKKGESHEEYVERCRKIKELTDKARAEAKIKWDKEVELAQNTRPPSFF